MGRNIRNKKDRSAKKKSTSKTGFRNNYSSQRPMSSAPREMHKATCSECNSECNVPFKPTTGKPVYCRECYSKKKSW